MMSTTKLFLISLLFVSSFSFKPIKYYHSSKVNKNSCNNNRYSFTIIDDTKSANAAESSITKDGTKSASLIDISLRISPTFSHPKDIEVTRRLANIPFIQPIIRRFLYVAESVYYTELLSSSVRVTEKQYPTLHKLIVDASHSLKITVPDLFVVQNPIPNAYTLAIRGRKPFVVVHSSLLDLLTDNEVKAVLGHELGHLVFEHSIWVSTLNLLLLGADQFLPTSISNSLRTSLYEWLRAAELSCDRAALLATKDINVVISMMIKLSGGYKNIEGTVDVNEFLKQAAQYEEERKKNTMIRRLLLGSLDQTRTHPVPVKRAKELYDWANSAQYAGLLARKEI